MSTQKVALVTGAGSGVGRAVALGLAGAGYDVVLSGRRPEPLQAVAGEIEAKGRRALAQPTDIGDEASVAELFARVEETFGRLDVLFNNAGIALGGPFGELSLDALDRVIDINFRGVAYGARMGYPYLKATPGSCLLNTASASAIYGSAGLAAYSATKFAVRGLTEALDAEWAAEGIKVRSLMPGFVDTALLNTGIPGTNRTARDAVVDARLEFTPVETVAQAAWEAVHGDTVHAVIGKTARRLSFGARWMPGRIRRAMTARALGR